MQKQVVKVRPNAHILMAAKQFYDVAELAWQSGNINVYAYPLIVNYSLCAELSLKAAEGKVTYGAVNGGLIGAASTGSTVWGHKLDKVFLGLRQDTQTGIEQEFLTITAEVLMPLLTKCADYFEAARYPYERKLGAYDLTAIRTLSSGLVEAVKAWGIKNPEGQMAS